MLLVIITLKLSGFDDDYLIFHSGYFIVIGESRLIQLKVFYEDSQVKIREFMTFNVLITRFVIFLCRYVVVLIYFLFAVGNSYSEDRIIKVGVSVPLSGPMSMWGTTIRNGIVLADKALDIANNVEFIIEDDQFIPKNAVSIVKKFIDVDQVQALLVFGSGSSLAVSPLAELNKIPMIGFGTASEISKGHQYSMIHWVTADPENSLVVSEVKKKGYKTVIVVSTIHDGMLALRDKFKQSLPDIVKGTVEVNPQEMDFMTIVTRIKTRNADAVYNLLLSPQSAAFSKQLRGIGFKGDLFSAHQVEDAKEVEASQGALVGTWFVSVNPLSDDSFISSYKKEFADSPKSGAGNGYDCAKMIIEGAHQIDLNSYLHNLDDFNGILGIYSYNHEGYFEVKPVVKKVTTTGFERM